MIELLAKNREWMIHVSQGPKYTSLMHPFLSKQIHAQSQQNNY